MVSVNIILGYSRIAILVARVVVRTIIVTAQARLVESVPVGSVTQMHMEVRGTTETPWIR